MDISIACIEPDIRRRELFSKSETRGEHCCSRLQLDTVSLLLTITHTYGQVVCVCACVRVCVCACVCVRCYLLQCACSR